VADLIFEEACPRGKSMAVCENILAVLASFVNYFSHMTDDVDVVERAVEGVNSCRRTHHLVPLIVPVTQSVDEGIANSDVDDARDRSEETQVGNVL